MSSSTRQPSSQPRDSTALLLLVTSTVVVSIATTLLTSYRHRQDIKRLQQEWENRRQEERSGRIRAEVKLRTLLKEQEQQQHQSRQLLPEIYAKNNKTQHAVPVAPSPPIRTMLLHCIGTVTSPFTKRMGTPRQPALVPASRGYIEFNQQAATALLDGIEQYSHLWVIFEFHANTSLVQAKKTKIRPPRAGGIKLGQLATRSPHRPNCLGLSLVRIETWDCRTKRLHISGIDLVHGTPVYDIKPFVPWDVPVAPFIDDTSSHNNKAFKVPDWVSQTDSLSRVDFTETATDALRTLVSQERLAPLYTNENDGFLAAKATLEQILTQDPRSSHKGLKTNARGTTTSLSASSSNGINDNSNNSSSPFYSLVFCEMQVDFVVNYDTSMVQVVKCMEIDFDDAAYVDGIPLISKQNNNTSKLKI